MLQTAAQNAMTWDRIRGLVEALYNHYTGVPVASAVEAAEARGPARRSQPAAGVPVASAVEAAEDELAELLMPVLRQCAAQIAWRSHDTDAADEIIQDYWPLLLDHIRRGRLSWRDQASLLHFLAKGCRWIWLQQLKARRAVPQPAPDFDLNNVPAPPAPPDAPMPPPILTPDQETRLLALFEPPAADQDVHLRRCLALLHGPFCTHGGRGNPHLTLAAGDLAALLGTKATILSQDRRELGKRLGFHDIRDSNAWLRHTAITARLVLTPSAGVRFLQAASCAANSAALRDLLALLQVAGQTRRREIEAKQLARRGAVPCRLGDYTVPIRIERLPPDQLADLCELLGVTSEQVWLGDRLICG